MVWFSQQIQRAMHTGTQMICPSPGINRLGRSQLTFLRENDLNFPWEKFPFGVERTQRHEHTKASCHGFECPSETTRVEWVVYQTYLRVAYYHRMYHHVLLLIILFYTLFEYELLVVGLGLGGVFLFVVFFHVQEWDVIVTSLNLLERNRKIKQTNLLFTNYSTADIPLWYFGTVLFYAISKLFFCFGVSVLIKWLHRSGYSLHYQLSSLVSTSDSFCQRGYSVNFVLIYKWSFFHPIAVQTTFTLVCDCS